MKKCDTCGNHYENCFELITSENKKFNFDCFECAIQRIAPECTHCKCKIIGHGIAVDDNVFCCSHCARTQ